MLFRSAGLGFTAKICLHPRQVHAVHTALLPTETEVIAARSLVEAWQAAATGAFQHQGKMIDLPVLNAARRKLAAWNANTAPPTRSKHLGNHDL